MSLHKKQNKVKTSIISSSSNIDSEEKRKSEFSIKKCSHFIFKDCIPVELPEETHNMADFLNDNKLVEILKLRNMNIICTHYCSDNVDNISATFTYCFFLKSQIPGKGSHVIEFTKKDVLCSLFTKFIVQHIKNLNQDKLPEKDIIENVKKLLKSKLSYKDLFFNKNGDHYSVPLKINHMPKYFPCVPIEVTENIIKNMMDIYQIKHVQINSENFFIQLVKSVIDD